MVPYLLAIISKKERLERILLPQKMPRVPAPGVAVNSCDDISLQPDMCFPNAKVFKPISVVTEETKSGHKSPLRYFDQTISCWPADDC